MEHNTTNDNTFISFMLTIMTGILGFISVNFNDALKEIDLLLGPIVKMCSILSFVIFLILNWKKMKDQLKKLNIFKKK